jgi:hypothetical protein
LPPSRSQVDRQSVDRDDGDGGIDCSLLSVFSIEDSAVTRTDCVDLQRDLDAAGDGDLDAYSCRFPS